MCVIELCETPIHPGTMTLAARLPTIPTHNACVQVAVPLGSWSTGVACCPNCRHELRLSLGKIHGFHTHTTHTHTAHIPPPLMIHLPPSPVYTTPPSSPLYSPYNAELRRPTNTLRALKLSNWYYGSLDWQGARNLLKDASVGAFLVRDSGDRNFRFSLSVQTGKGPTSVRLHYEQGYFRLDCDTPIAMYMPRFRCVVELVQHYIQAAGRRAVGTVWVDREGCQHSPVCLKTPLRKTPPTLMHSARLAIHKTLDSPLTPKLWTAPKHRLLPLPSTLIDYLGEYPFSV